jgi:hypothetical protein
MPEAQWRRKGHVHRFLPVSRIQSRYILSLTSTLTNMNRAYRDCKEQWVRFPLPNTFFVCPHCRLHSLSRTTTTKRYTDTCDSKMLVKKRKGIPRGSGSNGFKKLWNVIYCTLPSPLCISMAHGHIRGVQKLLKLCDRHQAFELFASG